MTPGLLPKVDNFSIFAPADFVDIGSNADVFSRNYPDNLGISSYNLIDLEKAVASSNEDDISKKMFIVSILIMHESSHWGMLKYQGKTYSDYSYEDGARWEENTFGTRFSYRKPRSAKQGDQALDLKAAYDYYNRALKSDNMVKVFGLSIFPYYSRNWDSVRNKKLPAGHKGDPVLESSEIKEPYKPSGTLESGGAKKDTNYSY